MGGKATWTDTQIDDLRRLWAEGLSAGRIAGELGRISRNSVIGKAHRLGLSARVERQSAQVAAPRPAKPKAPRKPKPPKALAWARRELPRALETVEVDKSRSFVIGNGVTFEQLDIRTHCRFPIGDPGTPDFKYCGGPREFVCLDDEIPHRYCAGHYAITHARPRRFICRND